MDNLVGHLSDNLSDNFKSEVRQNSVSDLRVWSLIHLEGSVHIKPNICTYLFFLVLMMPILCIHYFRLYLCWLKKKLVIIYFVNIFRSQFTFTIQKWWRCWGSQKVYKAWYYEARGELGGNISHIRLLYYILWVFIIIILFLVEIMHLSLYLSA